MPQNHLQALECIVAAMIRGEQVSPRQVMREHNIGNAQAYPIFERARERHSMWMLSMLPRPVVQS